MSNKGYDCAQTPALLTMLGVSPTLQNYGERMSVFPPNFKAGLGRQENLQVKVQNSHETLSINYPQKLAVGEQGSTLSGLTCPRLPYPALWSVPP